MNLRTIIGIVTELKISSGYEGFPTESQRGLGVAGIGAAAIGQAFNGATVAGATNSTDIGLDYFSCTVGGAQVIGKFRSIGFRNGDEMETPAAAPSKWIKEGADGNSDFYLSRK